MLEDEDPSDAKFQQKEMSRMRRLALYAVASSAISTSVTVLLIPLLYAHIQRAQTQMHDKVDFCRFR